MKFVKAIAAVAVLTAPAAVYAASPVSEADSITSAVSAVMAGYMDRASQEAFPLDSVARESYRAGVLKAFDATKAEEAYARGILEAMSMRSKVTQMARRGLPVDADAFRKEFAEAFAGKPGMFTPSEADAYLDAYFRRSQAPDTVSVASQEAYIASRAAREGAVTTPSGLVFEVLTEGEGAMPVMSDRVRVMYTGRLSDGTVFDTTEEPIEFAVSNLVPGFTEALTMMKPGGTYRICIPARIGYGPRGISGIIPGNSALDFEVQLLDILK